MRRAAATRGGPPGTSPRRRSGDRGRTARAGPPRSPAPRDRLASSWTRTVGCVQQLVHDPADGALHLVALVVVQAGTRASSRRSSAATTSEAMVRRATTVGATWAARRRPRKSLTSPAPAAGRPRSRDARRVGLVGDQPVQVDQRDAELGHVRDTSAGSARSTTPRTGVPQLVGVEEQVAGAGAGDQHVGLGQRGGQLGRAGRPGPDGVGEPLGPGQRPVDAGHLRRRPPRRSGRPGRPSARRRRPAAGDRRSARARRPAARTRR